MPTWGVGVLCGIAGFIVGLLASALLIVLAGREWDNGD